MALSLFILFTQKLNTLNIIQGKKNKQLRMVKGDLV